jgi:hypothetical protein
MPRGRYGQGGQRNLSGYMPLDESGMAQDESGGAAGGRCEQRLTSGLPKPITAPCGSLTQLAARSGTSAGTQLRFFQCTRWRSKRGNLGFPDDRQRNAAEV